DLDAPRSLGAVGAQYRTTHAALGLGRDKWPPVARPAGRSPVGPAVCFGVASLVAVHPTPPRVRNVAGEGLSIRVPFVRVGSCCAFGSLRGDATTRKPAHPRLPACPVCPLFPPPVLDVSLTGLNVNLFACVQHDEG